MLKELMADISSSNTCNTYGSWQFQCLANTPNYNNDEVD